MEKHGACKMDRQNKKCSCSETRGRRKNNDKKEEKKLAGPLCKKELPGEDALEGIVKGKKVRFRRKYQMIDSIMINGM